MKFIKKLFRGNKDTEVKNTSISARLDNRLGHIRRKMSRGASNIARVMKNNSKWGVWGTKGRKNHHKPH